MFRASLLSMVVSIIFVSNVFATPSNIIKIPSADVQPYGTFHLDIDNNTTMFVSKRNGGGATPTNFGLGAGFFDAGVLQMEWGMDVREPQDEPVLFNFKVAVPEGSINDTMPSVFLGGYDFGTQTNVTNFNILYGGISKTLSFIGRFTLGYFTGNKALLKNFEGKSDNNGIIVGFDTRLPKINDRLWFGVDFMGTNSLYGATSIGLGWSFSENASLTIGYMRFNDDKVLPVSTSGSRIRENLVSWQVDFDF